MQSTGKPNNARPKKKKNADETATLIIPQITPEVIARAREAMAQGMSAEAAAKLATAEAAEAAAAKATAAKAAADEVAAARAAARAAAKVSVKPRTPAHPRSSGVSATAEIRNAVHPGVSVRARPQQATQPLISAASAALSAPAAPDNHDRTASVDTSAALDNTASLGQTASLDTTSTINIPAQFEPTAAIDATAVREAAAADAGATSSAIETTGATQTETTAAPKPKSKNRVKRAAKQAAKTGPGTRRQAERELYRSIHDDHLWLNNPMMVRGLGLAPAVVAAADCDNALMLCLAALCLITLTRVLAVAICHLTGNRFRPLVYAYSAALVYIPTYVLMFELFGSFLTILGIYLPLLCVEPVVIKRIETDTLETVGEALHRGLNNSIGYCIALMLVGIVREFLASGTFFGTKLVSVALLPLAAQPAGGFILIGIICAVWTAIGGSYVHYKREEVRQLYADADNQ